MHAFIAQIWRHYKEKKMLIIDFKKRGTEIPAFINQRGVNKKYPAFHQVW